MAMGAGRYGMVGRDSAKSIFGSAAGSAAMSVQSWTDGELGVGLLCENGEHCRAHATTVSLAVVRLIHTCYVSRLVSPVSFVPCVPLVPLVPLSLGPCNIHCYHNTGCPRDQL